MAQANRLAHHEVAHDRKAHNQPEQELAPCPQNLRLLPRAQQRQHRLTRRLPRQHQPGQHYQQHQWKGGSDDAPALLYLARTQAVAEQDRSPHAHTVGERKRGVEQRHAQRQGGQWLRPQPGHKQRVHEVKQALKEQRHHDRRRQSEQHGRHSPRSQIDARLPFLFRHITAPISIPPPTPPQTAPGLPGLPPSPGSSSESESRTSCGSSGPASLTADKAACR